MSSQWYSAILFRALCIILSAACLLHCVLTVLDPNRAGAQRCRQEQGTERSYAWSPGLQRPSPHTTIYGAHPQGMGPGCGISVEIIVKKNNLCSTIHNLIEYVVIFFELFKHILIMYKLHMFSSWNFCK